MLLLLAGLALFSASPQSLVTVSGVVRTHAKLGVGGAQVTQEQVNALPRRGSWPA